MPTERGQAVPWQYSPGIEEVLDRNARYQISVRSEWQKALLGKPPRLRHIATCVKAYLAHFDSLPGVKDGAESPRHNCLTREDKQLSIPVCSHFKMEMPRQGGIGYWEPTSVTIEVAWTATRV